MRHTLLRATFYAAFLLTLSSVGGCAVGNRYDYGNSIEGLPVSGSGKIAVAVVDARPYVLSGQKAPDFVGLQRGGFGNPFDVRTGSGQPLAVEMREAISKALQRRGFSIVEAADQASRKMELRILEWKTDVMVQMKTLYDLHLSVFDGNGSLLASTSTKGEDVTSGGFESQNAGNAAKTFELRFTELVRNEDIQRALMASSN